MSTNELNVYEIFKTKFGEKEAKQVLEFFDTKAEEKVQQKNNLFLTIEDKGKLLTKDDAYKIFATKEDLQSVKVEMIKWFAAFFVSLALMIIGLYLKK